MTRKPRGAEGGCWHRHSRLRLPGRVQLLGPRPSPEVYARPGARLGQNGPWSREGLPCLSGGFIEPASGNLIREGSAVASAWML